MTPQAGVPIQPMGHRRARFDAHSIEPREYAVFGGVLRSTLEFPELVQTVASAADWTLDVVAEAPSSWNGAELGERRVRQETYRLYRTPSGYRLDYSHAGIFDISEDGSAIVWYPSVNAEPELARTIVLGPILALALELSGHFCLHGSAVAIADTAIAFVAPKHHGKSTLASALVRAGARFIGDDTLAVRDGDPPMLRPGTGSVRLWDDAARELRIGALCRNIIKGVKTTAIGFIGSSSSEAAVRLGAVYVLEPVPLDAATTAAQRVRLAPAAAVIALAHQAKLPDALIGYDAAGNRLARAAALAGAVPVFTLRIARSFAYLPAAVEAIIGWHSETSIPA